MTSEIPERYKRMQDKFSLPKLTDLRETFKFEIENEDEIIDQIRNEISEKLFTFTERIIEPIIAGSDSLCCLFEQNMITEDERTRMFELYKKIQALKWENNILMLRPDEKATAKWIKKTWNLWNTELEGELSYICKKLSSTWNDLQFENYKSHYHE